MIIKQMIDYIEEACAKNSFLPIITDDMIVYPDGSYHTETNIVHFVKENFISKDINTIIYLPNGEVIAKTAAGDSFNLNKNSFISVGIYCV